MKRNYKRVERKEKRVASQNLHATQEKQQHFESDLKEATKAIHAFEREQMTYALKSCTICQEMRLEMKQRDGVCLRCARDKNAIKLFSIENNMDPGEVPEELQDLTLIEQQLISRITPVMSVHLLKHGGMAANGHCVAFAQQIDQPAQIFPRLPSEVKIIKVRKRGKNDTNKDFTVRKAKIVAALRFLKANTPGYEDIIISQERIDMLPDEGEVNMETLEYDDHSQQNDEGPAPDQTTVTDDVDTSTTSVSGVPLPDITPDVRQQVQDVVTDVVGEGAQVTVNRRNIPTIPWPTIDEEPISEFTTRHFFTLAFPCLFPYGKADFRINHPHTVESLAEWADHLQWYKDGRFARHPFFKFIVHNMVQRKRTLEQSSFIVRQKLGEDHLDIEDLRRMTSNNDDSIAKKILYFGASLRGSNQYWGQRSKELRALIQYQINQGNGLPSLFTTGSCAEFYFKPLRRLLQLYVKATLGKDLDINNKTELYEALQQHAHIVGHYFDLRTRSYFKHVMRKVFGVEVSWYRYEFAKSRGMIHWHGLGWRSDCQPHLLLYEALVKELSDENTAKELANWAKAVFGLTACHPAGCDENGPRKNLWAPPEGTAPAPPEEENPLIKLLSDIGNEQEAMRLDHLLLCNKINLHRCSDYCLRNKGGKKVCRMEFGSTEAPGKELRDAPAIAKDKNGSLRLELERDHPNLVQHSQVHTQGWRANGDVSIILSQSHPSNPSVSEIVATEKYVSGYACKGNEGIGSSVDLFNDMVNTADTSATANSLCTKLLMNSVKRDVSAVEAAYEISSLPLYRCTHSFEYVSLSGARRLEKGGPTATKSTALDRYLAREENITCSWYQYVCKGGKVPVIAGYTRASWPLNEDYCRTMLLLHWPGWRKLDDITSPDSPQWTEKFTSFLETDDCPNFVKADVERARASSHHREDEEDVSEDEPSQEDPDWMQCMQPQQDYNHPDEFQYDDGGEHHNWSVSESDIHYPMPPTEAKDWLDKKIEEEKNNVTDELKLPAVDLELLNDDQKFAFNIVMETLDKYSRGENVELLRLVVSGMAGSGKSFLINSLVFAIRTLFTSNKAVEVICPTGNSANLIAGKTIHRYLKIPTGRKALKEMTPPDGSFAEELQVNLDGLLCLLVDERSLVGCNTFSWMEFHSRCGMFKGAQSTEEWGGLPVIVFLSDYMQLPPVCDATLYSMSKKNQISNRGQLCWHSFNKVVHLSQIIRQDSEQKQLRDALLALRSYSVSRDQARWLQQFQMDDLKHSHGNHLIQNMQQHALYVFPTHAEEWQHNKCKLLKINELWPIAHMKSRNVGYHATKASGNKSGGLLKDLYICKGAKVHLTVNIQIDFGLFNGAAGVVIDILYEDGHRPGGEHLPVVVYVDFPKYTGPAYIEEYPTIVPITPVMRRLDCGCCTRTQLPARLGWGTTIHRCQGMTIGKSEMNRYIVINPGTRKFESMNPGALYIAMSRAKTAGNDHDDPDFAWNSNILVNEDRLCHKVATPTTMARDKEIERLHKLAVQTREDYKHLLSENAHAFYTGLINREM